jgi:hypothetical protein
VHDVGLEADAALQRIAESASAADLDDDGWAIELGHQRLRPERATAEARPELLELRARPRPPLPAERIVQQDKVGANAGQNDGVLAEVDADRLALRRPRGVRKLSPSDRKSFITGDDRVLAPPTRSMRRQRSAADGASANLPPTSRKRFTRTGARSRCR